MTRSEKLEQLATTEFDVLIIGAGATGAGCALEAASRGLTVALIDANDFASGTSSKSSKLIHGGVRYLELAMKQRDHKQLQLVTDALRERSILQRIAPHLVHELRLLTPCSNAIEAAYYWTGLRAYDGLASHYRLSPTRWIPPRNAQLHFPELALKKSHRLVAYSDAQFDDARMAISIVRTAADYGACAVNYLRAQSFVREPDTKNGNIVACTVHDTINDTHFDIHATVMVNACGPQSDLLRTEAMPDCKKIMHVTVGAHIVVARKFWPHDEGILIPKTEDGRVLFLIPWHNHVIIGTTDEDAPVSEFPLCKRDHLDYIVKHASAQLQQTITSQDILSSWCGLRPLIKNADTKKGRKGSQLVRDHHLAIEENNLVTLTGGKWTTYRLMGRDCIDRIERVFSLGASESRTHIIGLRGGDNLSAHSAQQLERHAGISAASALQLHQHYGSEAIDVLNCSDNYQLICDKHHYLHCEIDWAVKHEYAQRIADILSRRLRLSFIDSQSAHDSVEVIAARMAALLGWSDSRRISEIEYTHNKLSQIFSAAY